MNNQQVLNEIVNEQEKIAFKNMRSDMETGKALLNPEQLGYFLREATLDNTLLRDADFKLMKSYEKQLNRAGINGRVLTNGYKSNGDTDPDITKADVDFGANTLNAKKLKAMCEIEDDAKEDNLEQGEFERTLMTMMGERIGEDLEYWSIFADTTVSRSDDALLNSADGWIKKAGNKIYSDGAKPVGTSKSFDAEDGPEALFDAMIAKLPPRFRKNRKNLKFYVPYEVEDAYRNVLISRGTTLGDNAQTGFQQLQYKGIPVEHCYTLDDDDGRGIDNTVSSFLGNPQNFAYGVYKNVTIEPHRKPEDELTQYWFRMRGDINYYFRNGVVVSKMTETEAASFAEESLA